MSVLKIALLQMASHGCDQEKNLIKGEEFCRKAAEVGADIALFPEMWNIGYQNSEWQNPAVQLDKDSSFVQHFQKLAAELNMAIALTYLEKTKDAPRDTVSIIDRHGKIVLTYAKFHTCMFDKLEVHLGRGDDFYVCDLDTSVGPVKIGAMICYDREFPESARILMLKGAEIILVPNASPIRYEEAYDLGDIRLQQLRCRAFENMVGIAMTNYPAPEDDGGSCAFDPRGVKIVSADGKEGFYIAGFNLKKLRAWRKSQTWGNAFRRPEGYSLLTSKEVKEPFVSKDALGRPFKR